MTKTIAEEMLTEIDDALEKMDVRASAGHEKALWPLRALAARLQKFLNGTGRALASVFLEMGERVTADGQEYRLNVRANEVGLRDRVLQAYVPAMGFPVVLQYLAETPLRCDDERIPH